MAELKVGDRVKIVADALEGETSPFIGKIGIVKRIHNDSDLPVCVKFPERIAGYGTTFFQLDEVEVVEVI